MPIMEVYEMFFTRSAGAVSVSAIGRVKKLTFDRFENLRQSAEGVFTFEPSPKGI